MKRLLFPINGLKVAASAIALAAGLGLAGCATSTRNGGGTLALHDSGLIQGRDLGRGGATAGGLSSVDPHGNSADYSVYDARQLQARGELRQ